jgi:hypothetical protein
MIQLPNVTLLCIDCVDPVRATKVIEICKSKCEFGAVKLLTDADVPGSTKIMPLKSLVAYSVFMLTQVYKYVDTSHMLIVQRDGWILNANSWRDAWLQYDYIGPLFMQYNHVGSGGFSLRSKRLMQAVASNTSQWNGTQEHADVIQSRQGYYEDGHISFHRLYKKFNIAPLEVAADFAQGGNRDPLYFREYPFGYHRTWQDIDFATGRVDSSDTTKDIHVTYDDVIDTV